MDEYESLSLNDSVGAPHMLSIDDCLRRKRPLHTYAEAGIITEPHFPASWR